ncbi:class I SAM-dependent methyltransferase [Candidatus Woesearchaeota archaeon]|nr:class I SAM-dependent methyltransferase [Candidatus Woesearchaeota archaeon]
MIKKIKYIIGKNLTFSQLKNRTFLRTEALKLRGEILDLGCGNGEYSFLMAQEKANNVTALDSSPELQGEIQKVLHDKKIFNISVAHGDAHHLPFKENMFDAVFCNTVLEHVENPQQVISEIFRVLKPEGTAIISIPFLQEIHADPYDFQRYTPFGLKNILERQGFLIKKMHSDYGVLSTLEYLLLGGIVWRVRRGFWKNFPLGYLYSLVLGSLFLLFKIVHLLFYYLQKQDEHFMTQVTVIVRKK